MNSKKKTKKKNTKMLIAESGELNKHMGKQHFQEVAVEACGIHYFQKNPNQTTTKLFSNSAFEFETRNVKT